MSKSNDFGKEAEKIAEEFLKNKGYEVLEKNWRYLKAEVDIIALKNNELIIVEVKARTSDLVMQPEEAVNLAKKKLLIMAADYYVCNKDLDIEVRFDIISIVKQNNEWKIDHIEEAFNSIL